MKFTAALVVVYAAYAVVALATPVNDEFSAANNILEKRRSCSGHREPFEVCQGNQVPGRKSSLHNCYRQGGHCCAKNRNRDGGINVTNKSQKGEDCGYCFTGYCKVERH